MPEKELLKVTEKSHEEIEDIIRASNLSASLWLSLVIDDRYYRTGLEYPILTPNHTASPFAPSPLQ